MRRARTVLLVLLLASTCIAIAPTADARIWVNVGRDAICAHVSEDPPPPPEDTWFSHDACMDRTLLGL